MGSSTISLGLGLGGGKAATSSGRLAGGGGGFSLLSGSFDGTDDYLTTDESNLATSGDCTISLWFNSASLPSNGAYDYMFSLTDGRASGKDRAIGIRGTGSDAQIVANTYASGFSSPFTNTSISASTWYHVAVVFTSGSAQVYFNGADKGSKSVATNTIAYTQTVIGGMLYSSANQFNGKIDEVSVFHSALSSTNITAIYNSGVPADISTLSPKGWWRNGDGTGDTDSGGGTPEDTDTIGTVANQGSVNTGSGEGNMTGTNGATYSNSVPVALFSRYSVTFDGSDDFVTMSNPDDLNFSGDTTISFWVKYTSQASGFNFLIDKSTSATARQYALYLRDQTGGTKTFSLSTSGGIAVQNNSTGTISVNEWNHVAVVVESGVTNGTKLYINGSSETFGTHTITTNDSAPFQVGKRYDTNYEFGGLMDEVAIFNSALSATDISTLRGGASAGSLGEPVDISSLNPVGWWRMGDGGTWDGTNWSIPDASENSNTGTTTNMVEASRVTDVPS